MAMDWTAERNPKAISLRAPHWWDILHCGKDIENRCWPTNYRGRIFIHAALWWRVDEMEALGDFDADELRQMRDLRGHIVGSVEIVDCVTQSKSFWHEPGCYGFVLRDPRPLVNPFAYRGQLGIFNVYGQRLDLQP